jgi:copper chaperone
MSDTEIKIDGMSCNHCVARVKKALDAIDGVSSAEVEIGKANVKFDESKITVDAIKETINSTGYKVVG